jgi:hypothetical protein
MLKLMEKLSRCGRLEADVTAAELIKETNDGRITFFHGNIGGLVKKRQFGKSAERRPLKLGFSLAQRPSRIGQSPANLAVPSGPNDFRSGVDGIIGRGEDGNFAYQFFYTADEYEGAEGRMARFGRMRAHPRSHNGRRLPSNGPSIGPRLLGGVGGGGGLGPSLSLSLPLAESVRDSPGGGKPPIERRGAEARHWLDSRPCRGDGSFRRGGHNGFQHGRREFVRLAPPPTPARPSI